VNAAALEYFGPERSEQSVSNLLSPTGTLQRFGLPIAECANRDQQFRAALGFAWNALPKRKAFRLLWDLLRLHSDASDAG
jgi:hypothetical protein